MKCCFYIQKAHAGMLLNHRKSSIFHFCLAIVQRLASHQRKAERHLSPVSAFVIIVYIPLSEIVTINLVC